MHNPGSPGASQYGQAAYVPLIKSPSVRVPKLVQVPPDIHPLPESVAAYFVYPYTLEPHILTLESQRQATFTAQNAHRATVFQRREQVKEQQRQEQERLKRLIEEEEERRRKEKLRKVAPGFDPSAGALVPKRVGNASSPASGNTTFSLDLSGSTSTARAVGIGAPSSSSSPPLAFPPPPAPVKQRDVMADLVDHLAALDAASTSSSRVL
ncbi:hypothetical protein FRC17_006828 [Serendipita sp. 399]|nr:hypothetical protein FRC17_006828 [Serendipita sp. 399]